MTQVNLKAGMTVNIVKLNEKDNDTVVSSGDILPIADPSTGEIKKVTVAALLSPISGGTGNAVLTTSPTSGVNTYNLNGGAGTYTNFLTAASTPLVLTSLQASAGDWQAVKNQGDTYWTLRQKSADASVLNLTTSSIVNLLPNSQDGLGGALLSDNTVSSSANNPLLVRQSGLPTFTFVKNVNGFRAALRISVSSGQRGQYRSQIIDLATVISGNTGKINFGVFLQVPAVYNGALNVAIYDPTIANSVNTGLEFVQLDNNWRFYRLSAGVTPSWGSKQAILLVDVNNTAGTTAVDIYMAAPSIIRTPDRTAVAVYGGIESLVDSVQGQDGKLYSSMSNQLLDNRFSKQIVGASLSSPWIVQSGGTNTFAATVIAQSMDSPIGNTCVEVQHSKRSADNFASDAQIKQTFIVPSEHLNKSVCSVSFLYNRESTDVFIGAGASSFESLNITFYSDTAATVTILVSTVNVYTNNYGSIGTWNVATAQNITVPTNTKAIQVSIRSSYKGALLDTIKKIWITGITVKTDTGLITYPCQNIIEKIDQRLPDLTPFVRLNDLYEVGNNPVLDSSFDRQAVGAGLASPFYMTGGNPATTYQAPNSIVNVDSPIGNMAILINPSRRVSDSLPSDNQPRQLIQIAKHLQGKPKCSFGFYMKRDSLVLSTFQFVVFFYSDKDGTIQVGSTLSLTPTMAGEVVGNWVFCKVENVTVPNGAVSAVVAPRILWPTANATTGVTSNVWICGITANFLNATIKDYMPSAIQASNGYMSQRWVGTKCYFLGDSMTAAGQYQITIASLLGITYISDGVSGSCVATGKENIVGDGVTRVAIVTRASNVQDSSPNGFIFIFGGTNDWFYNVPLGTINDSSDSTYYGAYKTMISKIQNQNPKIRLAASTMIQRTNSRANYTLQKQYAEATKEVCAMYGVPCYDAFSESGVTYENILQYTSDGVHPSNYVFLAQQFAAFLASL